jgi:hypothetical protein
MADQEDPRAAEPVVVETIAQTDLQAAAVILEFLEIVLHKATQY